MLGTVVDTDALRNAILASLGVGIGVTVVFSFAILGVARALDLSRDGRRVAAAAFATLGTLALIASAAAIAVGIVVMTSK